MLRRSLIALVAFGLSLPALPVAGDGVAARHGMVVAQEAPRGPHRRRHPAAGRQCGRCRGRDRLRAGRHLSARRQYRRRRLHGDPPRGAPQRTRRSRSTIARPRPRRPRATSSSTTTARPIRAKSRDSALAIGVPGTVAGLALAHAKYGSGKFTLAELIAPAIRLARDGIPIDDDVADSLPRAQPRLARWPSSAKIFLKPDGRALAPGDTLVQRDLADTLAAIAARRPARVLRGRDRRQDRRGRAAAGGLMTRDDLQTYRADRARAGARQLSRPRHHLDAAVVVRRRDPDRDAQHPRRLSATRRATTSRALHLMIEAMKLAYADRAAVPRRSRHRDRAGRGG